MLFKPRSIVTKLFVVFLSVGILIVGLMAILIVETMRVGFSDYLLQVELQSFDRLVEALGKAYNDPVQWSKLSSSESEWHDIVRVSLMDDGQQRPRNAPLRAPATGQQRPPFSPLRRPPPRPDFVQRDMQTPLQVDPLQLGRRLSLLDSDGNYLAGSKTIDKSHVTRPVFSVNDEARGTVIAYLALSNPIEGRGDRDRRFLREQWISVGWASALAIFLSAIASYFLARGFVAPIRSLVAGTKELTAGNYSARMVEGGKDEIGRLILDFNSLAESLEAAEKAERQWISDASHELKTPLAVLKGRIEGLQDGVYEVTPDLLAEMEQTVERLNRLVMDLNMLSHAREDRLLYAVSEEDLCELVQDSVSHLAERFEQSGLTVSMDLPETFLITCDRFRIRQLIDNLLENSRRYTDAPGTIHVSCKLSQASSSLALLRIEDSAPCPPAKDVNRLFERFYRTDPSRTRQSGGSGLGLAICRAIVKAHGGQIKAEPSKLGGLAVEIELPVEGIKD